MTWLTQLRPNRFRQWRYMIFLSNRFIELTAVNLCTGVSENINVTIALSMTRRVRAGFNAKRGNALVK